MSTVVDRRPSAGMTLAPRRRPTRPLPLNAVALRRGRYGDVELRNLSDQTRESDDGPQNAEPQHDSPQDAAPQDAEPQH